VTVKADKGMLMPLYLKAGYRKSDILSVSAEIKITEDFTITKTALIPRGRGIRAVFVPGRFMVFQVQ
jgi:hypothetical protein